MAATAWCPTRDMSVPYETPCFHSFQNLQREGFLSGSHISAVFARFSGLFPSLGSLVAYPVGRDCTTRASRPRVDELARETYFVRRKRTLDGSDFVQGLVFGYLHQADATTEELAQILGRREVDWTSAHQDSVNALLKPPPSS